MPGKKQTTPIAEEIEKRAQEDALEEDVDPDDPRHRVRSAHADVPMAEEIGKDAVRDLTSGEHATGERDRLDHQAAQATIAAAGEIDAQADVIEPSIVGEPLPPDAMTPVGVAVLLGPDYEDVELTQPLARLREAGHPVEILGSKGDQPLEGKRGESKVATDAAVGDRLPERYVGLLIPGGFSPDRLRVDPEMVAFVRAFDDLKRPIAAVCHGPQLLIEAGVVDGRRLTSWPSVRTDLVNAGAEVVDQEVVVDGHLITSRKPDDLASFSDAFLDALDAFTPSEELAAR